MKSVLICPFACLGLKSLRQRTWEMSRASEIRKYELEREMFLLET